MKFKGFIEILSINKKSYISDGKISKDINNYPPFSPSISKAFSFFAFLLSSGFIMVSIKNLSFPSTIYTN